ncbi:NADH:ubiquinone oxidoreductase complex i intermediate-associated protein 30 [Sulfitobacter sp. M57]|uniref:CIA30 family protein n=1 Tax=unclassified Sulfitobacter TaxID=196795 RepID=UPI0023E17EC2|nr:MULTISPECIES: CIA30 family protein [unclassified Sulfitobacter]MDF3413875.1 NADH:ubiquinone oxidoreductase complex i intermediate-associated protein 30 [Sulfitobacter sp. KE5]MDF3420844.1 NADH:ubiquinone oxidoreductase complex i intermediate-associated protein 30 [Sulfitobacter sp. KE43]MDF3432421.1 NADH:ubiquinone oxidoreductase complex i intermediate-associated protein 30 [Sulfitobacter sp. KE42]MDF3458060.1 NADH:ubiquinone oxidoreductase complex i intermediate-associated protein 30 [Sulfi
MELSPNWEYVADTVMGGVSTGKITHLQVCARPATRLTGTVSLENNGGFVQMACDLAAEGTVLNAASFSAVELEVYGNGEIYDLRLRTDQLVKPWQSYRAEFRAKPLWQKIRIPFADIMPHRTDIAFDPDRLRRIGVLAIGRAFQADVAVSALRLV